MPVLSAFVLTITEDLAEYFFYLSIKGHGYKFALLIRIDDQYGFIQKGF